MSIEDEIFKRYRINRQKLSKNKNTDSEGNIILKEYFFNNEFYAEIEISYKTGRVSGRVYDNESNEEFMPLRVETSEGGFVEEVKSEYKNLLIKIRDNYYTKDNFVSEQGNRIAGIIKKEYGAEPEFLWEDYPTYGIFRNKETGKWFGLICEVNFNKLDKKRQGDIEIINLKLDSDEIKELHKEKGYYPAWHMNKKTWITITLNDTVSDEDIFKHIKESYGYTIKKVKSAAKKKDKE